MARSIAPRSSITTRNPSQAYCLAWIAPKIAKLRSKYAERLKTSL